MTISDLLKKTKMTEISGDTERIVTSIALDSRAVQSNGLFFAARGQMSDGHLYINDAIARGACGIVYDREIDISKYRREAAFIKVEDAREALASASSIFYEEPSKRLLTIGITGTNGKTTTSYLMKSILEASGQKTGLIGTIQYEIGDMIISAPHTTPEAPQFQYYLSEMINFGCKAMVTEISSHSLLLKRVSSTQFDAAIFTNLTRDHLDFHGDMESYFKAKLILFKELIKQNGVSVLNIDDEYGLRLNKMLTTKKLTYGLKEGADVRAINIDAGINGLRFDINCLGRIIEIRSGLRSLFNVYNILSAFSAGVAIGLDVENILKGLSKVTSVRGRFEPVDCGQDFIVLVDYAHTDDALKRLIQGGRSLTKDTKGRVITVFGCGGNRDKGKRKLMAEVVSSLSDISIITSDNPRNEDPLEIINDVKKGISGNYYVESDRSQAISLAINMAEKNDVVLIAGKGHEDYQEIKGVKHSFDDSVEAKFWLIKRLEKQRV
ncbi:MAG: UDP-N-acetylmuramoyl-L-alanyl-D-glutamate--2,6-diaminopimelate ligase [Nitrospirae bacterium]|nr:UDP-N-acetylmuramoyl-L-alanyl-D-glutamate--2,6-diaminopimelate ligase [Nitrospirota bacterium]